MTSKFQFTCNFHRVSVGNLTNGCWEMHLQMLVVDNRKIHRAVLVSSGRKPCFPKNEHGPDEKYCTGMWCYCIISHESVFYVSLAMLLCNGSEHLLCWSSLLIIFALISVRNQDENTFTCPLLYNYKTTWKCFQSMKNGW